MSGQNLTINIGLKTIIQSILFVLLVWFLFLLRDLVLIVLAAVVIASAIEPAVAWFMKYKIPRVLGVLLVYLIVLCVLFSIFFFLVPPVLDEAANLLTSLPNAVQTFNFTGIFSGPFKSGASLLTTGAGETAVNNLSIINSISGLRESLSNVSGGLIAAVSGIFGGIASFLLVIVFSFYFAVLDTGVDDFLRIITPVKHERYIINLWRRSQVKIGRWMQGQLLLGIIMGVLVYLGLTIFGVKYSLLLAITAGVFEIIPVFGPILAAVPGVTIAFADGGITFALLIVGLYVVLQQFESHLIYPLVVTKVVGVPPLFVILALLVGAQLAGFLGIILSAPVAAVIQEYVSDREKEKRAVAAA